MMTTAQAFVVALFACVIPLGAGQKKYVWDLLKPALNVDEVLEILINAKAGETFPVLTSVPEDITYSCDLQKPGFYADAKYGCQVFHRCDIHGNLTSYLCVPSTLFNQVTLVCDYFFNVDCSRSSEFADFANSRLYTDEVLFDTPPTDYVPPARDSFKTAQNSRTPAPSRLTPKRTVQTKTIQLNSTVAG